MRLAPALAPILAGGLRWFDYLRVVRRALAAAEQQFDGATRAWALHELGTLSLAGGDVGGAARALTQATEIRRAIGDSAGLVSTERNLDVLGEALISGAATDRS